MKLTARPTGAQSPDPTGAEEAPAETEAEY